jgi:UDP-glucose 4-epimerase
MTELLEVVREVAEREVEVDRRPSRAIDVPVTALDCTRLREATGWSPKVGIAEGVSATWEWIRSR